MSKNTVNKANITTTNKKIGFFAVMLLTIGTCIGAGIFFKNSSILDNTQSIILSVVSWVIAIFAVLMLSLTLTDLVKGSGQYSSLGMIGWIRGFCGKYLYKGFKNFFMYIYLPTNSFFMPYYAVMSIQDSVSIWFPDSQMLPTYLCIILSACIMLYFIVTCSLSTKLASTQNICVTFLKFIPIAFAIVGGIVVFILNGGIPTNPVLPTQSSLAMLGDNDTPNTFVQLSPGLGVIASIPAIFFAFDGFYSASAAQKEMKEPKKAPMAMALGIAITSAIYVLISIALLLGSDGNITGLANDFFKDTIAGKVIMTVAVACITFAVFGVINGFALYGFDFYRDLIKRKEVPFHELVNPNKNWQVLLYSLVLYVTGFALFTTLGFFYFEVGPYYGTNYYGYDMIKIYNFCDLISNWTSLIVFIGLGCAVLAGLIKKYNHTKGYTFTKYFSVVGIISVTIICISILYECVSTTYDLVSISLWQQTASASITEHLIPIILQFVLLIAFMTVVLMPTVINKIKPEKVKLNH